MGDGGRGVSALCDHCGEAAAVLYCCADTAKLCLPCDGLVHAANALSRRHGRSPLCDNCAAAAAAALCAVDGLALCPECDWNAHSAHPRTPIEAFSDCPSALELAAAWGFDLSAGKIPPFTPRDQELSPCSSISAALDSIPAVDPVLGNLHVPCTKRQKSGRGWQELLRQLVELAGREPVAAPVPGELSPRTPSNNNGGQYEKENRVVEHIGFTSLLNLDLSACAGLKGNDRLLEDEDLVWDCGPSEHVTQLNMAARTGKWQNNATDSAKPSGTKTLTGYLHDPGPVDKSKEISFGEQSYYISNGTAEETKKADSQLLAHNRDKAMLRYKEKRTNRRYDRHIRYESRKARADSRKRLKGRFVRSTEA
ncbi:zinc finger protein CONSTANS-LIKE 14-like isoform X2 [Phoenix dactylifera]|uniref:Zinc finger protein CONSTANS-LIKE 14-like isoform X2 n=1 Tax=Phoenix dactylifera TaxID=42345 RepID=A0A8B9AUV6_PHODC|nr:zinc finger protein CONSTANS-LIKE 14-like isoform X2 [Phoenix dactylifera]